MALDLIVLDCDGVILESMDIKGRAFAKIGKEFGQEMSDRLLIYHAMHGGISRYEKFAWLYEEVYKRPITSEEVGVLNAKFVSYAMDELRQCELVAGVEDVLKAWQGRVPIYVASAAPHQELNDILTTRGLASYFTKICGSPPAKTQLLRNIIKEAGVDPLRAIMVGDSMSDKRAAEDSGCHFYGRGKMFEGGKYPWAEDLTELNQYLEGLARAE